MSAATSSEMKVERKDLNPCTVQLEISCSAEQFDNGFAKAAKDYAKQIRVPGFRPGHAPKAMVEKLVNPEELARNGVDQIVRDCLIKALNDLKLQPDNQPAVAITKFDKDNRVCEFSVKVPLPPVVKLGEYKGLSINRPPVEVTDEEVKQQLDELRGRKGKKAEVVGRGVQDGDMAVINIRADGEEGEGRTFMIVAGQTFKTLDKTLNGMGVEEIRHADLDFPASFQEKDWAGKKLKATVTVRSVSTMAVPELDDEFAKSLKASDMKDLEQKVREGVLRAKTQISQEMVNEQLFDTIISKGEVMVPDTTWESVAAQRLQEMANELGKQQKSLEDYAKENGMTLEEFVTAQQTEAKTHVQRAVVIEHIFKNENMKIDNDDANRHFLQIAYENNVPQEQLTKFAKKFNAGIRNEIVFRTMHAKVVEFLNEHSTAESDAPVKKKTTKK
ncbi:MAG: trigger factor [Chthonomonadaceae bacterium]|nr:trigger factor [Chthonomonadaceae bacterium]